MVFLQLLSWSAFGLCLLLKFFVWGSLLKFADESLSLVLWFFQPLGWICAAAQIRYDGP